MKHLGDITKINGYEAPTVDVVVGGSPCQDLSVAGKRAGLDGERSGLFMEQIRIIKEMRAHDREIRGDVDVRPRYMVWENVPGAFSSNEAEDFRIVLQETARIAEPDAVIPRPPKGKWTTSGCIMGNGWSIAWRVLDAQFWGVPQRRRRIALVADFGGQSAPEILFVRKGVSGDIEPGEPPRKEVAANATGSIGADDRSGVAYTLKSRSGCEGGGNVPMVMEPKAFEWHSQDMRVKPIVDDVIPTISAGMGMGGANMTTPALIMDPVMEEKPVICLQGNGIDRADTAGCNGKGVKEDVAYTLNTIDRHAVAYQDTVGSLCLSDYKGVGNQYTNDNKVIVEQTENSHYIVRRLTPLECERLQGYPDGWTDIGEYTDTTGKTKKSSDAARYKALGNSIALPPWKWVMKRISACYERDATLASLFDGIGGFPLIWEQINGKGSCLWASEIEDFPIAVTKVRIGE